ncbi:MAG: hypothetical protein KDI50_10205 [Candidatus Competibacteraceae bacterium]|nr:hypothetical protein [Candidatus Competibacteraceae bacterium]
MAWQELVTCALLGTERQAPPLTAGEHALGALLRRLDGEDRESALLRTAGALALWRRAGQNLAHDPQPLPPACPPDETPVCGSRAGECLTLMLQGHYAELLPEWLTLLRETGQRIPEEYLPMLLDAGAKQAELRPALLPVLGQRGRWLARQQTAWSFAVDTDDEQIWQTGPFEERLALLRQLRGTRAERALELLTTTWKEEVVRQRKSFLQVLADGLSMVDEPFLETVLDDRSTEIARIAADLLARLPESRLTQRLTARALLLLRLTTDKRDRLEVDLPEEDAALARDGITGAAPPAAIKLGEKAWCLSQLIGAVPPATWQREWQRTPAQILAASRNNEWRKALLEGWARAAERYRDPNWAEALLPIYADHATLTAELAATLSSQRFEAYLLNQMNETASGSRATALVVLSRVERPWSVALARAILEQVRQRIHEDKQPDWWLANALRGFARWIPLELSEEAATHWPRAAKQWRQWEKAVEDFLDQLRFRRKMREAITE